MKKIIRLGIGALAAVLALLVVSTSAAAHNAGIGRSLQHQIDQTAIEDLAVCYARGTDTLGRAVTAVISTGWEDTVNIGNAEFDAALALYRQCFSKDFSFDLEIPPFGVVVTRPDLAQGNDGALQWANFVNDTFRGSGYVNTQHHMGSISSEVHGKTGHMVSYLIATHGLDSGFPPARVDIVGGTYTDEVVWEEGRWVILKRTLLLTSNVPAP